MPDLWQNIKPEEMVKGKWIPRIARLQLEVKKTEEELKQENRKQSWLEDLWARRPLWSLQGQQPVAPTTLPYSTMQVPTPMADLGKAFAAPIAGSMLKARAEGKSVPEIISAPLIQLGKEPSVPKPPLVQPQPTTEPPPQDLWEKIKPSEMVGGKQVPKSYAESLDLTVQELDKKLFPEQGALGYWEAYSPQNLADATKTTINNAMQAAGIDTSTGITKQWQNLTPGKKREVAELYNADIYKNNLLGSLTQSLKFMEQQSMGEFEQVTGIAKPFKYLDNLLLTSMTIPITAFTSPISKKMEGQEVTKEEWAFAGLMGALMLVPFIPKGVGTNLAVPLMGALEGMGISSLKNNWDEMSPEEKSVFISFLAMPFVGGIIGAKGRIIPEKIVEAVNKAGDKIKPEIKEMVTSEVGEMKLGKEPEKVTPVTGEVTPPIKPPTITTKGLPENPVVRSFYDFVKKLNTEKWWVRSEIKTGHKAQAAALEQLQKSGLSGRELYQAELKVLGGKLKPDITAPEMTPQNINELFNIVNKAELKGRLSNIDLKNALDDMFGLSTDPKKFGRFVRPQPHQIDGLTQIFGKELGMELLKIRKISDIVFDRIMSVSGIPRVLQTMVDHSRVLRQDFVLTVSHPQLAWKNIGASLKSLKDPKIAESAMKGVENNKYYDDANSILKVYRAPIEGEKQFALLSEMEEAFQTNITTSPNPILRKIFLPARLSERIYNLYGNLQRYGVTYKVAGDMEKAGLYGQWIESAQAKNLGQLINWASGRGSLPKWASGKGAVVLNQILYSPRYLASIIEYPYRAIQLLMSPSTPKPIRLEVIRQIVSSVGAGTAILAMINQSGVASVEIDPRSTDFGQLRVGNTRINFWGGYKTWAVFLTQLAVNERKTTTTENIVGLNRLQTSIRFLWGKAAPPFGQLIELLAGQTYLGEKLTTKKEFIGQQAFNKLTPMFIQSMVDAIRNDGWLGGFLAAPGFFGTTITSYKETEGGGSRLPLSDYLNKSGKGKLSDYLK